MAQTMKQKLCEMADGLASEYYAVTFNFPKYEQYSLGDQIRRSLISVPSNLVEGFARYSDREKARFCRIAKGSLAEATYQMQFASNQGYFKESIFKEFKEKSDELSKLLLTMIRILEKG